MCPSDKVDPTYCCLKNITDVSKKTLEKIKYFFSHYKDLENKKVKVGDFLDKKSAINIYLKSCDYYEETQQILKKIEY
jgi:inorganic pyrophosphatase